MYQVTWIEGDELFAVQSPNYESMRRVYVAMLCQEHNARFWDVSHKGKPELL